MARRRLKVVDGVGWYHVMTRIVGGERFIGEVEKRVLRRQVKYLAEFCGVRVLTYALMDNHFHLLLEIASPGGVGDEELLRRIGVLYGSDKYLAVKAILEGEDEELAEEVREGFLRRMGDVSEFMKELKQRFSIWFNRTNKRFGTLWAERFKSVLVEGKRHALVAVAAYIDLNCVRTGRVKDPGEERFSGYGEAVRGGEKAREGLCRVARSKEWAVTAREYRVVLFGKGARGKFHGRGEVLDRERVAEVLQNEGELSPGEFQYLTLPAFSEGVAVGSPDFVEKMRLVYQSEHGGARMHTPWRLPLEGGDLHVARGPRKS